MKVKNKTVAIRRLSLLLTGLSLLAWNGFANANFVTQKATFNQPVDIDWKPNDATDFTGVRVLNQDEDGDDFDISIKLLSNDPVLNRPAPEGFLLLDNTLLVTSTKPAGKRRIRIRMDYGRFGGRAGLRARGIRANTIRLLRINDPAAGRWSTAVRRIAGIRIADIRYRRLLTEQDFKLGRHGYDGNRNFAWAVTNTTGEQYFAIGGLAIVPLPAAWLLFLSGSGLLLMVSRKRQKTASTA